MTDIAERVAKGAAFLDESQPGWDARIDLKDFSLASPCRCVLGQLATDLADDPARIDWRKICLSFGVSAWEADGDRPSDAELGFNIIDATREDEDDDEDDFHEQASEEEYEARVLTAEWRRVIETRRAS